jgi:hypothetical protein
VEEPPDRLHPALASVFRLSLIRRPRWVRYLVLIPADGHRSDVFFGGGSPRFFGSRTFNPRIRKRIRGEPHNYRAPFYRDVSVFANVAASWG